MQKRLERIRMFGKKAEEPGKVKWTFDHTGIYNNATAQKYNCRDIHFCFRESDNLLCIWHNGRHLTTIKCDPKVYSKKSSYYLKTDEFVDVAHKLTFNDNKGNSWVVDDGKFQTGGIRYNLMGIRFEQVEDGVLVFNYGTRVAILDTQDIDLLNREKNRFLEHKCRRLSGDDLAKLLNDPLSLYSKATQVKVEESLALTDRLKTKYDKIIITTEMSIDTPIEKRIEVISAEVAFGMNLFKDIFASLSDTFGGRNKSIQNTLRDARETVMSELRKEAYVLGADAVVAVDLDYSEFSGGGKSMLFCVATGTAVKLKKI